VLILSSYASHKLSNDAENKWISKFKRQTKGNVEIKKIFQNNELNLNDHLNSNFIKSGQKNIDQTSYEDINFN